MKSCNYYLLSQMMPKQSPRPKCVIAPGKDCAIPPHI